MYTWCNKNKILFIEGIKVKYFPTNFINNSRIILIEGGIVGENRSTQSH